MGWSINHKEVGVMRNYEEGALGIQTPRAVLFLISSRDTQGTLEDQLTTINSTKNIAITVTMPDVSPFVLVGCLFHWQVVILAQA